METIKQLVNEIQSGNTSDIVLDHLKNKEKEAPYASLVYILRAMNVKDPELRFQAAIYSPDRGRLKRLVKVAPVIVEPKASSDTLPGSVLVPQKELVLDFSHILEVEKPAEVSAPQIKNRPLAMWKITPLSILANSPSENPAGDGWKLSISSTGPDTEISTPLNDYLQEQTSLAMKKTEEISSALHGESKQEEVDLVSKFLAKPTKMMEKSIPGSSVVHVIDAKATESLHTDDSLVTETLAKLHLRQNHPEEAIQVYQQLSLRYPEKRRYFEAQIQKIKENEL